MERNGGMLKMIRAILHSDSYLSKSGKNVLLVGNSLINELFATIACIYGDAIDYYRALDVSAVARDNGTETSYLKHSPLREFSPNGTCSLERTCSNQLAHV